MNYQVKRDTKGLGRSFKGVTLYLVTPKLDDPSKGERTGLIETRNLPTDDAHQAWRIMAGTAERANELKAEAGLKATGRKLEKPVFHYALNWHPDDNVTPEQMMTLAADSLELLGLGDRQALIVQHTDAGHPHVHIVVNRVDPETGRAASLGNNWHKLDEWCNDQTRANGWAISAEREAKYSAREAERAAPANDQPRQWLPYEEWQQQKRAAAADDRSDRAALFESQKAARDAYLEEAKAAARQLAQDLRAQQRAEWSAMGKAQWKEKKGLENALDTHSGMVAFVNAHRERLHAAFDTDEQRRVDWGNLLTPNGLKEAVGKIQAAETAALKAKVQEEQHEAQREFWADYRGKVEGLQKAQAEERAAFKEQQKAGNAPEPVTQIDAKTIAPAQQQEAPSESRAASPRSIEPNRYEPVKQDAAAQEAARQQQREENERAAAAYRAEQRAAVMKQSEERLARGRGEQAAQRQQEQQESREQAAQMERQKAAEQQRARESAERATAANQNRQQDAAAKREAELFDRLAQREAEIKRNRDAARVRDERNRALGLDRDRER